MQVNFYADLRQVVGGKTVGVNLTLPVTVRAVLEAVTDTRPDLAERIWAAPGVLHQHIHVFVNGRQSIFLPQGLETLVQADDELDVFPPVGGGAAACVSRGRSQTCPSQTCPIHPVHPVFGCSKVGAFEKTPCSCE